MMLTEQDIEQAEVRRWQHRYESFLDQVPVIVEHLRDMANPLKAARLSERVGGGGGEAPAPIRLDPVDDCDDLWAALVEYVVEVAERLQEPAPEAAHGTYKAGNSIRGISARLDADGAYKAAWWVVAWLTDRGQKVRMLALDDTEGYLFGLIRKLQARYIDAPPVERPAHRRFCTGDEENPGCGNRAVAVDWLLNDTGEASCRVCGLVYEPTGRMETAPNQVVEHLPGPDPESNVSRLEGCDAV